MVESSLTKIVNSNLVVVRIFLLELGRSNRIATNRLSSGPVSTGADMFANYPAEQFLGSLHDTLPLPSRRSANSTKSIHRWGKVGAECLKRGRTHTVPVRVNPVPQPLTQIPTGFSEQHHRCKQSGSRPGVLSNGPCWLPVFKVGREASRSSRFLIPVQKSGTQRIRGKATRSSLENPLGLANKTGVAE